MTILTIPLSGDNNSLPPPCLSMEASTAYPSPRGSGEYEEYEKVYLVFITNFKIIFTSNITKNLRF